MQCFCGTEADLVEVRATKAKARTFTYKLVYGNYPGYAFKGFNNAQTVRIIREGFANLSSKSGAKFVETTKNSANLKLYFQPKVMYNALAVYVDGKIYMSQTRPIGTEKVGRIVVQHETLHYLGYKSQPSVDKWGHAVPQSVFDINATSELYHNHLLGWLIARYGK